MSIKARYTLIAFVITIALTIGLILLLKWDWLICWLISISIVTFGAYGYDKSIAGNDKRMRVPERVLLLLALAGGSVAAWIAMKVFHHKTIKGSFQRNFGIVVVAQIAIVIAYLLIQSPAL
jgi:uncharacterized membrane protein YsdA (DUF1294 family)